MPETAASGLVQPPTATDLIDCVDLPIVVGGRDCALVSFNPAAATLLSLEPSDVGRPLGRLLLLADVKDLEEACQHVMDGGASSRWQVQDGTGSWFSLRIGPWRVNSANVAGCVLTLTNVTALHASLQQAVEEREYAKAVMNTVVDPLVVVDEDSRVQAANQSFYTLFETTREASRDARLHDLGKADWDVPRLRTLLDDAGSSRGSLSAIEMDHEFAALGRRTLLLTARRLHRPRAGKMSLLAIQDITDRKQAEQALQRRTAQFAALLDAAPIGVYLVDADFRIREMNPTAREEFGDLPNLVGRDFDEVVQILWPVMHAEIVQRFRHTLVTGEPYAVRESVERRLDGGVSRSYEWQINRMPLPEGGYGVVCYFRDISVHVWARGALAEAEQRLRFMAESMPQKIFTAKGSGDLDYFNPQWTEFTGLTLERIRDEGWREFVHGDDVDENIRLWRHSLETGEPFLFEHRFRRADGQHRWHISRAVPMRDVEGKIVTWVGSSTDIHDLRETQEALKSADRIKDEFLAVLSHELRTPLNAIVGWAHVLQGGTDAVTSRKAIDTIIRNARIQTQLVADVLDVSRIVAGKLRLEPQRIDPAAVIRAALDTVEPATVARSVDVTVEIDPAAGLIWGDRDRLQQVVWNLLANAIKFVASGGHVWVRLQAMDSEVEIAVEDDGPGIDPAALPYIFERFRQADSSTVRRHRGLGLGLAIVRHVVELHGGTAHASNRAEGSGAVFRVRLPRLRADAPVLRRPVNVGAAVIAVEGLAAMPSLAGFRILLVDDEQDARDVLTTILERCGADVVSASSASEGLAQLEHVSADVLLADIAMPDEDGYSLIRRVRALPPERGGRIPAAAVTAHATALDRVNILRQGFQAHVPKPVEPIELVTVIASLLDRGSSPAPRQGRGDRTMPGTGSGG